MSKTLEDLLKMSLPYFPRVYHQASYTPSTDETVRNFNLIYKFNILPSDSLIFFIPSQSSISIDNGGTNNLVIKVPKSLEDNPEYDEFTFNIVVETNDGSTRKATLGDIIAYRMCIFRFAKGNTNTVILTNSPSYNSLQVSNLVATNAKFINTPVIAEDSITRIPIATQVDIGALGERLEKVEDRIIFGVQDPDEALASKPNGTLYVQIEED